VDPLDVREAIGRIKGLPTLPSVLGKIFATVADPDASALDLGNHITADQSLSAALLKLVNSAYYGFFRQIDSVTTAIVMLGFVEVRNLVLAASTFRALSSPLSKFDRMQLWRHSLATAMASERCAKVLGMGLDDAFVCGLLHDIGKVVLDVLFPERFEVAAENASTGAKFLRDAELEVFGMDHGKVGGILGEHWNLPTSLVDAIRYHHTPEASKDYPAKADLTALANFIAHQAGVGKSGNGCDPVVPEEAMARLGASEVQWQTIRDELQESDDRIGEILGALVR